MGGVALGFVSAGIKRLPVYLFAAIYLPMSILGLILFRDRESIELFVMILLFFAIYLFSYDFFSRLFLRFAKKTSPLLGLSTGCWYGLSLFAFSLYVASLACAVHLSGSAPILVALEGGSLMEIAQARGQFLAGLEGYESLLRYLVFILGRSVMPLLLVAAFFYKFRIRYLFFAVLLVLSMFSLEKAAPIFVFLPFALYLVILKMWRNAIFVVFLMCASVGGMTILAMGGVGESYAGRITESSVEQPGVQLSIPPGMPIQGEMGRPGRSFLPTVFHDEFGFEEMEVDKKDVSGKLIMLLNRVVWIPYITAYDWLGFHYSVLGGELTLGRSIGFIHLLYGEPKMPLEKMVYVYEFGASPGGQGASNTVFFVDAKLAFGWVGVIAYCFIFTFCAACIFSSGSPVLIASSIVCFLVASVSSLTATLLSGGLFIYVVLAFLLFDSDADPETSQNSGRSK